MKHTHTCQPPKRAPQLRIYREEEPATALNCEEEREKREQRNAAEEFWAGRNHAMRQSARVAA
jgi:hypothetical protein